MVNYVDVQHAEVCLPRGSSQMCSVGEERDVLPNSSQILMLQDSAGVGCLSNKLKCIGASS